MRLNIAVAVLLISQVNGRPGKLSRDLFNSILTTSSLAEFAEDHDSSMWDSVSDHAWVQAEALYRRSLGSSTTFGDDANVPFVVCDTTPDVSGYERRMKIEGHFGVDSTHPVINTEDITCYSLHADHNTATTAPDDLLVHPHTPSMKLPADAVGDMVKDVSANAKSIQLDLCRSFARTWEERQAVR